MLSVLLTGDSVNALNPAVASVKCAVLPVKQSFAAVCARRNLSGFMQQPNVCVCVDIC